MGGFYASRWLGEPFWMRGPSPKWALHQLCPLCLGGYQPPAGGECGEDSLVGLPCWRGERWPRAGAEQVMKGHCCRNPEALVKGATWPAVPEWQPPDAAHRAQPAQPQPESPLSLGSLREPGVLRHLHVLSTHPGQLLTFKSAHGRAS